MHITPRYAMHYNQNKPTMSVMMAIVIPKEDQLLICNSLIKSLQFCPFPPFHRTMETYLSIVYAGCHTKNSFACSFTNKTSSPIPAISSQLKASPLRLLLPMSLINNMWKSSEHYQNLSNLKEFVPLIYMANT